MRKVKKKVRFGTVMLALLLAGLISGCAKKAIDPHWGAGDDSGVNDSTLPVLYDFTPKSGLGNTVIKISGKDFDTSPGNTVVFINDLRLAISSVTSTEIVATIPAKANTGKLVIGNGNSTFQSEVNFTVMYASSENFFTLGITSIKHFGLDRQGVGYGDNGTSIYKIGANGITTLMMNPGTDFKAISDFTMLPIGDIYVANQGNFNIAKITPERVTTVFAGDGTEGYADGPGKTAKFSAITGIAHDILGNLYVNDAHRVRKISATGVVTTIAGNGTDGYVDAKGANAQFGSLEGIVVDEEGTIYVTDRKYRNIRRISADGVVTTLAGGGAAGFADGTGTAAQFSNPRQLAIDLAGNIWVTDENSSIPLYEVRVINKFGVVTTFIKGMSNNGVLTGSAVSATVNSPLGLTFDLAGNLYIANTGAGIVSKLTFRPI
ncbi:IPT/TIG domain-containing protein [Mucilaginibacter sp. UR6-11]|uniref:IPT/TIG domain-containing protein n=1 Tax=Mucilaginibacter sp. UR6-11 TaxID=1435644 RepID=UPI001E59FD33|nr:IPT/TIG domain-containing protein [Mucilaginibacter sp. UR6-11]MCC8425410.1 IPT/TIG domain-containing protein [Mucilaginibacter sp. UR6-11]